MVDIHTHLLPQMDDGAKSVAQSLEMLLEAAAQGVTCCVATPHCVLHGENGVEKFLARREKSHASLLEGVRDVTDPLPQVLLGAEVFMDHDLLQHDGVERLCIEGTQALLVEFPTGKWDARAAEWLYSMTLRGIRPILAHIDRYTYSRELLSDTEGLDVIYQVNAEALLSFRGRRLIKRLIANGLPYVIGSDMHNMTSRPPRLGKAREKQKELFSAQCSVIAEGTMQKQTAIAAQTH